MRQFAGFPLLTLGTCLQLQPACQLLGWCESDLAYILSAPKSTFASPAAGASSGIGEASAHRFAEAGCKLVIAARRTERLQALQKELQSQYQVLQGAWR